MIKKKSKKPTRGDVHALVRVVKELHNSVNQLTAAQIILARIVHKLFIIGGE